MGYSAAMRRDFDVDWKYYFNLLILKVNYKNPGSVRDFHWPKYAHCRGKFGADLQGILLHVTSN
jgi:hypothetical protein